MALNPAQRIFVAGLGAVSPAGWDVASLMTCLRAGTALPDQPLARPGWDKPLRIRPVPTLASRPPFLAHPRLRRVSPLTQYAASAAMEAIAQAPAHLAGSRLAIVFCLQIGPVQYASRFFQETLSDPATASPLLFPETVFSAPASHVAALVGNPVIAYTLMGDPSAFLQGLALGVEWLLADRIDACLVVGAEEFNWVQADAVRHFNRQVIVGPGAAAVLLTGAPPARAVAELAAITDPHPYSSTVSRAQAALAMRRQLPAGTPSELLCDGLHTSNGRGHRPDLAEVAAWQDWPGLRLSPKALLGEGLMASAGWQCVAAIRAVADGTAPAVMVSLVGSSQQALGARFVPAPPAP